MNKLIIIHPEVDTNACTRFYNIPSVGQTFAIAGHKSCPSESSNMFAKNIFNTFTVDIHGPQRANFGDTLLCPLVPKGHAHKIYLAYSCSPENDPFLVLMMPMTFPPGITPPAFKWI